MYQAMQNQPACFEASQLAPAGLTLPVPAHRIRSCSTRRTTRLGRPASLYLLHPCSRMNLARSIALHAAQKPTSPATREIFELGIDPAMQWHGGPCRKLVSFKRQFNVAVGAGQGRKIARGIRRHWCGNDAPVVRTICTHWQEAGQFWIEGDVFRQHRSYRARSLAPAGLQQSR